MLALNPSKLDLDRSLPLIEQDEKGKFGSFQKQTLVSQIKTRRLLDTEKDLNSSMSKAFIPVNPFQAKSTIMRTVNPDYLTNINLEHVKSSTIELPGSSTRGS